MKKYRNMAKDTIVDVIVWGEPGSADELAAHLSTPPHVTADGRTELGGRDGLHYLEDGDFVVLEGGEARHFTKAEFDERYL